MGSTTKVVATILDVSTNKQHDGGWFKKSITFQYKTKK